MKQNWFIEPFVDTGLGNSAYLIGSHDTKRGILIDPLRDVDRYLHAAAERGIQVTHVLDTHLHADFVAGHLELRDRVGATIYLGASAKAAYAFTPLGDGAEIELGSVRSNGTQAR